MVSGHLRSRACQFCLQPLWIKCQKALPMKVLKPTKIEGCQLSEERGKGYKMEKSGRKKLDEKGGKLCGRKGCEEKGTQLCSRCKSVSYCSVACSETYWPEHRSSCSKEKEKKQMRRRQKEKVATEVD